MSNTFLGEQNMRTLMVTVVLLIFVGVAPAKKKAQSPLTDRFLAISCAVVQISTDQGTGTGFFVSPDGDMVTAAHVAINSKFSESVPGGPIQVDVDYKPGLRLHRLGGAVDVLQNLPALSPADGARARSDLALIRTGLRTPCFLRIGAHPEDIAIGQHLIGIGFPESATDRALYEGIASARYKHPPVPVALLNGRPLYPDYDVLRIQMPITAGASGGPVIADDDDVVGVIVENPEQWFVDLNTLIDLEQANNGFSAPVSDLPKLVGKLAWVVHDL